MEFKTGRRVVVLRLPQILHPEANPHNSSLSQQIKNSRQTSACDAGVHVGLCNFGRTGCTTHKGRAIDETESLR